MLKQVNLRLPEWVDGYVQDNPSSFETNEQKMSFVLGLARENILRKTGGPFSAAIFNKNTNQLVSCGVNRVMAESCSTAHAEVMAIMVGQKTLNTFDFSLVGNFQLVTSGRMCIMCLGNVIWSGLEEVVYSADTEDVQSITGFDEGPVPKNYNQELINRGINVVPDVLKQQGRETLELYVKNGGYVYNSTVNKLPKKA